MRSTGPAKACVESKAVTALNIAARNIVLMVLLQFTC
jgi:hypothetical protein